MSHTNPYASTDTATDAQSTAKEARRSLAIPATVLLVTATPVVVTTPLRLIDMWIHPEDPLLQLVPWSVLVIVHALLLLVHLLITVGSVNMLLMRSYKLARIGAIAACVPMFTTCTVIGVPFGIWALVVLSRTNVRSQFSK